MFNIETYLRRCITWYFQPSLSGRVYLEKYVETVVIVFFNTLMKMLRFTEVWSIYIKNQWPKVPKIVLNVFVIVIVFAFFFVVVFLLVRSCFRMTPINFARFRFGLEGRKALNPTQSVSQWVSYQGRPRDARTAKNQQKSTCQVFNVIWY